MGGRFLSVLASDSINSTETKKKELFMGDVRTYCSKPPVQVARLCSTRHSICDNIEDILSPFW